MTELVAQDRAPKPRQGPHSGRRCRDRQQLATHPHTRQNVARLTAEAVIEQRSDGCYDQTAQARTSSICAMNIGGRRTQADADHVMLKTEMPTG
jgi:hypothetical protein